MTEEEFQRKMDFIVEQQAQFASDIQQLQEDLHQLVEAQAQTNQVVTRLANVTAEGFKNVTGKIDALVDSHIRLTEAQSRTDENLRNLIAIVDRYFREGRDGKSGH